LPKEKKQKDEKVQAFGQSTFNLYEVLKGKTEFSLKLPVYATPGSTLETQPSDAVLVFIFKKLLEFFETSVCFKSLQKLNRDLGGLLDC
jgi:hypothetical protein